MTKHYNSLTVIMILVGIASILYLKTLFPSPISKERMENEFSKNTENLQSIADYLVQQKYTDIYITSTDTNREMLVYNKGIIVGDKNIPISNDFIAKNVADLFEKHDFEVITKEENGVYF